MTKRNARATKVPHCSDLKEPGNFTFTGLYGVETGGPYGMIFVCPCGCGSHGSLAFDNRPEDYLAKHPDMAARPKWHWDGDLDRPTLSPSILKNECPKGSDLGTMQPHPGWHGFLRAGVFEEC